jgi:hypothetical protein
VVDVTASVENNTVSDPTDDATRSRDLENASVLDRGFATVPPGSCRSRVDDHGDAWQEDNDTYEETEELERHVSHEPFEVITGSDSM